MEMKREKREITFKPLKSNRLKCNQTGDQVRAGQIKTYRRNKLGGRPKKDITPPELSLPRARIFLGYVYCPNCGTQKYAYSSGKQVCSSCNQVFIFFR